MVCTVKDGSGTQLTVDVTRVGSYGYEFTLVTAGWSITTVKMKASNGYLLSTWPDYDDGIRDTPALYTPTKNNGQGYALSHIALCVHKL